MDKVWAKRANFNHRVKTKRGIDMKNNYEKKSFWQDVTANNNLNQGISAEQTSTDGRDFERIAQAMANANNYNSADQNFNWHDGEDEIKPRKPKAPEIWDDLAVIPGLDGNMPIGAIGEESLMSGLVLSPEQDYPEQQNTEDGDYYDYE